MNKTELVKALKLVEPALSNSELLPILTHFWFLGKTVLAFNDHIAIEAPLSAAFKGAIPGQLLLKLVETFGTSELNIKANDTALHITAGITKAKLPLLHPESFIFKMPDPGGGPPMPEGLIAAIELCMRSVSTDTSEPEQLGVTLIPIDKELFVFATDSKTITRATVKLKKPFLKSRVVLSTEFCKQLMRFKGAKHQTLVITQSDKDAYALFLADDVSVFGRLINAPKPLPFTEIFDQHVPDEFETHSVPIPKSLRRALERACIVAGETRSQITIDERQTMQLLSKSEYNESEVKDHFHLHTKDGPRNKYDHPPVTIKVSPQMLLTGCKDFDYLMITEKCCIMEKAGSFYLVSAIGG